MKAVDFKSSYVYNSWYKVKEFIMTQPTREQILNTINKVLDQAIENQKAVNSALEQSAILAQAQAVVIKDIIDTVDIIEKKIDNIQRDMDWAD